MTISNITESNKMFGEEKIGKLLFKFSVPAIISLMVAEMYNMVDSMFLGQAIGANAIGALTIAFPIQRLFFAISMLIAIGASTSVSRSCGDKDFENLKIIIPNAIVLMFITISIIGISIFVFQDKILISLGASKNTFSLAKDYINIILVGVLFQSFTIIASYIITSFGNTKIVLLSTSIGAIFNVIIDYFLINVFSYGVKGAAIATVVSQIIAFIYVLIVFIQLKMSLKFSFKLTLNKAVSVGIVCVGFSTFIIEISDAIVAAILNNLLFSYGGDSAIVTIGLTTRVSMFLFMTVMGISTAMQPIAAYNFGAGNYTRLKEVVKSSIIAVSVSSTLLWAIFMIFSDTFIGLFINDKAIIEQTSKAFRMVIAVFPCIGVYYLSISYCQAINRVKASFKLSIFRQLIVFIPLVYSFVIGLNMGVSGAWLAYPISDVISFITAAIFIRYTYTSLEILERHQIFKLNKIKIRLASIASTAS
ncbi:MATE family efflux transporter [Clostridium estertheticum]|uniref:MATE family efflux transporter n=1 Tax=Clostridium estertheticum TaxID=238834 RepID=UPI001C0B6BB4|nr:MATE family efflux transporter [Clostridium estertheticum]MBU3214345.1 MATE family efflux transporter [Clostridium estertheticum]WAG56330.1 MATE family efflux transporter [Clostridium estertheticum]